MTKEIKKAAKVVSSVSRAEELPVVARLVVEIRSDGSKTIARGALEDVMSGEQVAIEAIGTTPLQLALQLAKSMMAVGSRRHGAKLKGARRRGLARRAMRKLLPKKR